MSSSVSHTGPSCSFTTTSTARQGTPLPARDWSRIPRAGPSSSNEGSRPAPKAPQRRNPSNHQNNHGTGGRPGRVQKVGWNGTVKQTSFGLRNKGAPEAPRERKEDLTESLKKWNLSASSAPSQSHDEVDDTRDYQQGSSRFSNPARTDDDTEDRHNRRLKSGERPREARGFEASRRASQDGDFVINRNTRQGSKKGKEREHDHRTPTAEIKRPFKPKKGTERVKAAEKEVYIPSTVTVSRLADIFGVKICKSIIVITAGPNL